MSAPPAACRRSRRGRAPAFGLLEAALRARLRAGEGALLVAEQLALDKLARDSGHVDGDERAPRGACRTREARARPAPCRCRTLALDHHGEISPHQAGQHPIDLLHGRRATVTSGSSSPPISGAPGRGRRPWPANARLTTATSSREDRTAWPGTRRRLLSAAVGAVLKVFWAPTTMIGRFGPHLADARDEIEAVLVRHHHVGDDDIGLALALSPGAACAAAPLVARGVIACPRQRLIEHRADSGIVAWRAELAPRAIVLVAPVVSQDRLFGRAVGAGAILHGQQHAEDRACLRSRIR